MARKTTNTTAPEQAACPECGAPMVRIVYGYPSSELFARSARGEVALGGCVISGFGDDPTHRCRQGHEWCWTGEWTRPGAWMDELLAHLADISEDEPESSSDDVDEDPAT